MYRNYAVRARILMVMMSLVLCGVGSSACGNPRSYEALPRSSKPVPDTTRAYFLAIGNGNQPMSALWPDELSALERKAFDAKQALIAAPLITQLAKNRVLAAAGDLGVATLSGNPSRTALAKSTLASAQAAYDAAVKQQGTVATDAKSALWTLQKARENYLAGYGIQPPDSYISVIETGGIGWILSSSGQLLKADKSWRYTAPIKNYTISALATNGAQTWSVGTEGTVMHLTNDGTWELTAPRSAVAKPNYRVGGRAVTVDKDSVIWVVGDGGLISKHDDSGWKNVDPGDAKTSDLSGIAIGNSGDGWAVGSQGTILKRTGDQWQKIATAVPGLRVGLTAVAMREANVWIVGEAGTVLRYDGSSWNQIAAPVTGTLTSVALPAANYAWIVGADGVILRCTATDCATQSSPTKNGLQDIAMAEDGKSGWIVGNNNTILRWDGKAWVKVIDWEMMAAGK